MQIKKVALRVASLWQLHGESHSQKVLAHLQGLCSRLQGQRLATQLTTGLTGGRRCLSPPPSLLARRSVLSGIAPTGSSQHVRNIQCKQFVRLAAINAEASRPDGASHRPGELLGSQHRLMKETVSRVPPATRFRMRSWPLMYPVAMSIT